MSAERISYSFSVLRYVHDIASGEFVNVGVAIHVPKAPFLGIRCTHRYSRSNDFFQHRVDGRHFRAMMQSIEQRFHGIGDQFATELALNGRFESVLDAAAQVLPSDSSGLQWSPIGSGITRDPQAELDSLFQRLVEQYERPVQPKKKDEDVWNTFRAQLSQKVSALPFEEKVFKYRRFHWKFEHAWKNGQWNVYEPMSFDLSEESKVFEKATRWIGKVQTLRKSDEPFKIHFLVGSPTHEQLLPAFREARELLQAEIPGESEVVTEEEAPNFAERVAHEWKTHQIGLQ